MPKDIRLIGHIATFRIAGKKVVHTPLKGVVRTIIMQKSVYKVVYNPLKKVVRL